MRLTAYPATGLEITSITFYTNGVFLGAGIQNWSTNGYHFYLLDNLALPQGIYRFDALAVDSSNLANKATVYVTVASNAILATNSSGPGPTYTPCLSMTLRLRSTS